MNTQPQVQSNVSSETSQEYFEMFDKYKAREITEAEWKQYCMSRLADLLGTLSQ